MPRKLGIKTGVTVGLIGAPRDFEAILGELPAECSLRAGAQNPCTLLICFVRSRSEMGRQLEQIVPRTDFSSVWFAWPKKASGIISDLSERCVRESGLAAGLVDYKICAIDSTWSGLLFARRKQKS